MSRFWHSGLNFSTARGALRIAGGDGTNLVTNGIDMHTTVWDIPNLMPLWVPGNVRGADVLIPGTAGVLPYRRRQTVTPYSLPLLITGRIDLDGQYATDPWEQLELNLLYLTNQIVVEPGTVSGTRDASLTMPSGTVRTAEIHVLSITPGVAVDGILRASLAISIPSGRFA